MRGAWVALLLMASCAVASATTTLRLHSASIGTSGYGAMDISLGPFGNSIITSVTNTTASGTHIQATATGAGAALAWMSEPFASGVTMNGTETMNFYGKEASAANNASVEFDLYKYSGGSLGSAFCTGVWGTELTTSMATHAPTCSATSTTFATGDQLVVKLYIVNCATSGCPSGTMGAGSPGVTIDYDGYTAGSDGDTNLATAERITFTPVGGSGGTPSCSNIEDQMESRNGGFPSAGSTTYYLPAPSGANNTIIAGMTGSAGDVFTCADDQSNVYNLAAHRADTTNTQDIWILMANGIAANTHQLVCSHSASDSYVMQWAMECTNVATAAALDVSTGNNANSATITAGSVTPNYSGDLFIQSFWNEYTLSPLTGVAAGSQSNISWALAAADRSVNQGVQWGVYSSTSALNPTMSETGQTGFVSVAIALKSSSAGTPFASGLQSVSRKTLYFSANYNSAQGALPRTEQFPCASSDNGMALEWLGASGAALSGVTDSNSNTWTSTGVKACAAGAGGCSQAYYSQNPTITNNQALTFAGTLIDDSAKVYCMKGASTTSFFDNTQTATGNQTVAGNLTGVSITTAKTNEVVITALSVASNTQAGISSPAGGLFAGCLWSAQSVNPDGCDENNGWGNTINPSASTETFIWSPWSAHSGVAAAEWINRADAFESSGSVGATGKPPLFVIQP